MTGVMSGALGRLLDDALRRDGAVIDLSPDPSPHGAAADAPGAPVAFDVLRARAEAVARALAAHGLRPHEPVHLAIGNRAGDLAAMLGIWRAGGVAVPVHVAALPATRARAAALTGARLAVDGDAVTTLAAAPPPPRALLDGAALIVFTSGSTGHPKGVVLGHDRLAGKLDVLDALLRVTAADTVAVPLQMTFIFGIWACLLTLRAGGALVLVPRFSAAAIRRALGGGATVLAAVPSMLRTLAAEDALAGPGPRLLLSGGEVLGPALRDAVARAWPRTALHDLYGLTETGSCDFHALSTGEGADTGDAGTIGRPTAGVAVRIAGPDGRAPAADKAGELQIRTPYGMLGYLDDPALTAAAFEDGHFRTGDLARAGPDGRVTLVGRLKEIVSRGGNKIAPQEIDDLLATHPDIAAALCAGVPDARLGEALHAVVVPRPGAALTAEAVRAWAAARIERFKLPDVITIAPELPMGPTGKASRTLLRERALAGAAAAIDG